MAMHRYLRRTLHALSASTVAAGGAFIAVASSVPPGTTTLGSISGITWTTIGVTGMIAFAKEMTNTPSAADIPVSDLTPGQAAKLVAEAAAVAAAVAAAAEQPKG